jgi:2-polyprenyl-6-methoxyphenol hydroxylase-like FAD-dependent oxidoreductase
MGGLINRIRRFVDADGAPLAHGFLAIGDAHTCTNPLYGRGSSLAVLQAVLAADAIAEHGGNRAAAARAYEAVSAARVEPWYHVSLMTDLAARSTSTETAPKEARTQPSAPRLDLQTLRRIAASGDPELSVLVAKTMSLLLTPQEVFGDPAVVERLSQAAAVERPRDPNRPKPRPLTREAILAAGS